MIQLLFLSIRKCNVYVKNEVSIKYGEFKVKIDVWFPMGYSHSVFYILVQNVLSG